MWSPEVASVHTTQLAAGKPCVLETLVLACKNQPDRDGRGEFSAV